MPKINKSVLKHGEPERVRDEAYRRHVASQPCTICGGTDVQAAHESFGNHARGLKASDDLCFPLCLEHHERHDMGILTFWSNYSDVAVDLIKEALQARYKAWVAAGRPKP